jgi:hypothetical protein
MDFVTASLFEGRINLLLSMHSVQALPMLLAIAVAALDRIRLHFTNRINPNLLYTKL